MLNMLSDLETAIDLEVGAAVNADAQARTSFGSDACLPSGAAGTTWMRVGSVIYRRPRDFWAASVSGQRRAAAGLAALAFGQPAQPIKQYPHTTRIAASGGTKGPHPAREPEPA
ncbi:MAG TPA: hypothetical protein VMC03_12820 [Streptosporangiaceae bacterium]|nr:hypothetical protein [Streptosporangiaceae bacterium]